MSKNIDYLGNEINPGDVMIEFGIGSGCLKGSDYKYHLKLWEVPENYNGHGYYYSIDGTKHIFAWAVIKQSMKFDMSLMPDGFEYSFKHGMSDISTKLKTGTVKELVENSNWKEHEVTKAEVDHYNFLKLLKLETVDDIKKNINELNNGGYIPYSVVHKIFSIVGITRSNVYNGEIGISSVFDQLQYKAIIKSMS